MITSNEAREITLKNEKLVVAQAVLIINQMIKEAVKNGTQYQAEYAIPSIRVGNLIKKEFSSLGYMVYTFPNVIRIEW